MPIFKKEEEVLDLTDLEKRGLLKKAQEIEQQQVSQTSDDGYMDLGTTESGSAASSVSSDTGAGALGFLDSLAGVGASSNAGATSSGVDTTELQGLKSKIDDLEYKLQVLEDKIERMDG
ncbi:MAG: hypothetical protein KJ718_02050 [Nanoarchaeota archaeon]|nr:hypothetical protein [Nanoarchaeota archaeon]MBU1051317.1 hypothetical protein [Nanoarchaeota archaeon]MBU1988455.1 hypothetical protein [Nanoarchaeota archaeon]